MIRPATRTLLARLSLAAVLALLLAAPAHADERLLEVRYDEARVYRIEGRPKVQATIRFADDESIENVAVGDSNAWQITPNKRANLLFLKPLQPRASTNMTVVTDKRTYLFDLVASPTAQPLYVLSFTYPEPPAPRIVLPPQPALAAAAVASAPMPAETPVPSGPPAIETPAALNFAWTRTGQARLLPESVFDDGEATYLTWTGGRAVPAILVTDPQGTEGPVNFTVRGNTIVVEGVPPRIVLRSGKQTAQIINAGPPRPPRASPSPAPAGIPAETAGPQAALAQQEWR